MSWVDPCSCSASGVDSARYLPVHQGELFSPEGELAEGVTAGEVTRTTALQEREDVIHHLAQTHVPAQVNHSWHTYSYKAFNHTDTQSVAVLTEGVTDESSNTSGFIRSVTTVVQLFSQQSSFSRNSCGVVCATVLFLVTVYCAHSFTNQQTEVIIKHLILTALSHIKHWFFLVNWFV